MKEINVNGQHLVYVSTKIQILKADTCVLDMGVVLPPDS